MDLKIIGLMATILAIFLIFRIGTIKEGEKQSGGSYDPYAWIRPTIIIDFFRTFWLTR